jgi:hypothetical protein
MLRSPFNVMETNFYRFVFTITNSSVSTVRYWQLHESDIFVLVLGLLIDQTIFLVEYICITHILFWSPYPCSFPRKMGPFCAMIIRYASLGYQNRFQGNGLRLTLHVYCKLRIRGFWQTEFTKMGSSFRYRLTVYRISLQKWTKMGNPRG